MIDWCQYYIWWSGRLVVQEVKISIDMTAFPKYSCLSRVKTLRLSQNGHHFPDDIFNCIFFKENVWISIKIPLKFVPKFPINNIPALVQIMAWRRPGDKPLHEAVMVSLLTDICITHCQPQWVNSLWPNDVIWHRKTWSLWGQVMTCYLTASSHFQNQCWLIISDFLCYSLEGNYTINAQDNYHRYELVSKWLI